MKLLSGAWRFFRGDRDDRAEPEGIDDLTDRRNRRLLNCGPGVPDTQFARRVRAFIADQKRRRYVPR